jgi:predicted RND superfamily exporter protein
MNNNPIIRYALDHPRRMMRLTALASGVLLLLVALPSLWPGLFSPLAGLEIDTDPENMLPQGEPVRVFHNRMKRELLIYDMVVVGVVNEAHPDGVFNPQTLRNVFELTEFARTLRWPDEDDPGRQIGVVAADLLAPSTVDNIEQGGLGSVRFDWLMAEPPATPAEALAVRDRALAIPFLNGTLVSEDGMALALYLPLTSKDITYRVYNELRDKVESLEGEERYFITGLPVAEDNFGVEMFIQMAISAPLSAVIIFLLMLFFFRKFILVISPMLVAMASVVCTMCLLVATGHTVHIMSSMIPIFIMPIAVIDAVHILSLFFDRYPQIRDRRVTLEQVMQELYTPMLYTSLTTAAGFASLALAPIPPVQVFGLFVAFGVMLAWFLTITLIPAYIMLLSEDSLEGFGLTDKADMPGGRQIMVPLLHWMGEKSYQWSKPILVLSIVVVVVSAWGISRIVINDNPIRWFDESHDIRVADRVLNQHFGGTYMAFLSLAPGESATDRGGIVARMEKHRDRLASSNPSATGVFDELINTADRLLQSHEREQVILLRLDELVQARLGASFGGSYLAWEQAEAFLAEEHQHLQLFKQPEVLAYLERLQSTLQDMVVVGKTNSLVDIVKTIHKELYLGEAHQFRVPDTPAAVAQTLLTFQNSHRPQDLWHFVTPDYRRTSLWVQMRSGDNIDMLRVVDAVDRFVAENPPPHALQPQWFGLTYINMVWQERMVSGMLGAFLGSFVIVSLMMLVLLRSGLWAILSMIPLMMTIAAIYGLIGLIGKDYDMPVAVLSALALGLAVDFAIHFLVRARARVEELGSWQAAAGVVFGAPARAITRNGLVISLGFLPLLLAPLVPYQTVGALIAAILFLSGGVTLVILPALIRVLEPWLFPKIPRYCSVCNYINCMLSSLVLAGIVLLNLYQFADVSLEVIGWLLLGALVLAAALCRLLKRDRQVGTDDTVSVPADSPGKDMET